MRFTSEWLAQHEAKRGKPTVSTDAVPAGEEASLHDEATRLLRSMNLPYLHSRMDRAATCTPGAPDLVFVHAGRVVLVEFKTRVGKLSQEQTIWHFLAKEQGVLVHVVRSVAEFRALLGQGAIQNAKECGDSGKGVSNG